MKIKIGLVAIGLLMLVGISTSGSEFEENWGPEVGTSLPELAVKDTSGKDRDVKDLTGEKKGLVLFFVRTSNW